MKLKDYKCNKVIRDTIGFIRSGVHPNQVLAFKNFYNSKGIDVFAICEDMNEKKQYASSVNVFCLEEWLKSKWNNFNVCEISKYQNLYKEYNLWEIYYADRYIRYKYEYEDALRLLIGMITFWESIFSNTNTTFIVSDCIIGANSFLGMIVGEKYNVTYISIVDGRFEKYRSYISTGEGYINDRLNKSLEHQVALSEKDINATKKYINEYIKNKTQPAYMSDAGNMNKQLGKTFLFYLKRLKNISYLWDNKFDNKFNIHLYKGRLATLDPLLEALRKPYIKRYFQEPEYKENYILFPLHFQPEASTCVYARKYENQLFFIEQLSKSIPAETILYVKEHSVRQGHRPFSFYKQLEKYPNVKLISPNTDSHDLIRRCKFVVCLTSTMGFEALMYGKPVFVCGDCFFEDFPGVIKIHDVFDEKYKFLNPPTQNRQQYYYYMTHYLKTLNLCTTLESTIYSESSESLYNLQKETAENLLEFIQLIKE